MCRISRNTIAAITRRRRSSTPAVPAFDDTIPYTTNLQRHWKANQLSQADNTDITSWTATSPATVPATGGAGTVPKYRTNVMNGYPVARFNGVDQKLSFADTGAMANFTIFVVQATTGDSNFLGWSAGNMQVKLGASGANQAVMYAAGAEVPVSSVLATARGSKSILEYVRNGNTVSFFENGTARGTGPMSTGQVDNLYLDRMGYYALTSILWVTGDIAEILVYNADIGSTNRASVRSLLQSKYGI